MKEREPGQKPMCMGSEEITISGGNKMDEQIYQAGHNKEWKNSSDSEGGRNIKKVHESSLKWYGHVLR